MCTFPYMGLKMARICSGSDLEEPPWLGPRTSTALFVPCSQGHGLERDKNVARHVILSRCLLVGPWRRHLGSLCPAWEEDEPHDSTCLPSTS